MFDTMFTGGKRLECFSNDAPISVKEVEEKYVKWSDKKNWHNWHSRPSSRQWSSTALREHKVTFRSLRRWYAARKDSLVRAKVREKLLERLEYRTVRFGASLRRTCTLRPFVGAKCNCYRMQTRRNGSMRADDWRRKWRQTRWLELGSQMRKSSQFRHRQIPRMIVSTPPFLPSVMFRQNGCSRAGSTSLRVLWCPWQCPNVARRRWCLSNREQRSTAHTTVTMC